MTDPVFNRMFAIMLRWSRSDPVPKLFVSYSHADRTLARRLEVHLSPLKETAQMEIWSDSRIGAGDDWEARIITAISEAAIAVLLVTANFFDSKYIRTEEVPRLLARRATEGLRLVPVLARACAWNLVPWLRDIQIRPLDANPVWRKGGDADRELSLIAIEVEALTQAARDALEKASQARSAREEIERERRDIESAVTKLVASGRDSIMAATRNDFEGAMRIQTEIDADAQKRQMERWKILQDTQAKIFHVMQDVTANRAQTHDEAYRRWDEYIRA